MDLHGSAMIWAVQAHHFRFLCPSVSTLRRGKRQRRVQPRHVAGQWRGDARDDGAAGLGERRQPCESHPWAARIEGGHHGAGRGLTRWRMLTQKMPENALGVKRWWRLWRGEQRFDFLSRWLSVKYLVLPFLKYPLVMKHGNGKSTMNGGFNRKNIDKWAILHCHVWLPEDTKYKWIVDDVSVNDSCCFPHWVSTTWGIHKGNNAIMVNWWRYSEQFHISYYIRNSSGIVNIVWLILAQEFEHSFFPHIFVWGFCF